MPIATTCPNCKALFRLADELAGKKVKCQKCQCLFVVPKSDATTTTPGVLASAGNQPVQEEPPPAAMDSAPPPPMPLPPMPVNPPHAPAKAEDDDAYEEDAGRRPPVSTKSRDGDRAAPESRRDKAKARSAMLPVLLTLLGLGAFFCIGCSGGFVLWHFAAGKRDVAVKNVPKKDGAVKIDGRRDLKKDARDGFKDKKENPPPGPAIAVNFGPDGIFRQNNQLTRFDPVKHNLVHGQDKRHKLYAVRLEANRTYQIDLVSNDFDAFLYLVDDTGQVVAWDDDSGGGINNLDARILYAPVRAGVFHIEATHFSDVMDRNVNTIGNFTLIVQRLR